MIRLQQQQHTVKGQAVDCEATELAPLTRGLTDSLPSCLPGGYDDEDISRNEKFCHNTVTSSDEEKVQLRHAEIMANNTARRTAILRQRAMTYSGVTGRDLMSQQIAVDIDYPDDDASNFFAKVSGLLHCTY